MTFFGLLVRNLFYHWRGNAAVFLGVAVGTAVLTGALLVGDSLRGSLRDLTEKQLGWVDQALISSRFIRAEVAAGLPAETVSSALLLQGAATSDTASGGPSARRAGRVTILGVDDHFWQGYGAAADGSFWNSAETSAVVNAALAEALGVHAGDAVVVHLQKASDVPRESLLGRRDAGEVFDEFKLTVHAVLSGSDAGNGFNLNPSPEPPRNLYVPLHALQAKLGLEGRVNAILVGGGKKTLSEEFASRLDVDDWGLVLRDPESRARSFFAKLDRNRNGKLDSREWPRLKDAAFAREIDRNGDGVLDIEEVIAYWQSHHPYLSLESRQLLLEPAVVDAALAAAGETHLTAAPTLVYLANSMSDGRQSVPYSVVAAVDPSLPPPLGPLLPGSAALGEKDIVLVNWLGNDTPWDEQTNKEITLTYFAPEQHGLAEKSSSVFHLKARIPLQGVADDSDLTPEFPGITDKMSLNEWDPPPPLDRKEILRQVTKRDEDYWKAYFGTPKAYVSLASGRRLWGSRFGQVTSIRLAAPAGGDLAAATAAFRSALRSHLKPEQSGLVFNSLREDKLAASTGGTDFSGLFLGFSVFLIAAALLLVGLLFRLNLDRRAAELGVLLATGYRRGTVRWLLLGEGIILAAVGGLVGLGGAVLYAWLLLELLGAWWPGLLDRSFLRLHVTGSSFLMGYFAALVVSLLTIVWAVRVLGRVSPRALLAGETTAESEVAAEPKPRRWTRWIGPGAGVLGLGCIASGHFLPDHEAQAGTFFSGGALLLTAGLMAIWAWMRSSRHGQIHGHGMAALARLGMRNAARHPVRSLLTAGLLASSAFLIVAVESFRRHVDRDYLDLHSGSGGFALLAESDLPIYADLNTEAGREDLYNQLEREFRQASQGDNQQAQVQLQAAQAVLREGKFYPLRLRAGDDASCLNLYQPRRPRLLGVPQPLIDRGGFQFAATEANSAEERENPWRLLDRKGEGVPVFGEENTVKWMLHSQLGGELKVPNSHGQPVRLRIVGLLKDSVFQSGLLLSEANFLRLYPGQEGYNLFLVEVPPGAAAELRKLLTAGLADHGFEVTPTAERLESYLAVENTYLTTFQALGGLGLVLGALGLAVVLLRSVWERRGELALLRALGYRRGALGWLVLAENGFLLALGLGVGALAALLSVAPHLLSGAGHVPWLRLAGLLGVTLLVGLTAGAWAVAASLRAPLLVALRRE